MGDAYDRLQGSRIIEVASRSFDDFAASGADMAMNRKMLGIG